MTRNAGASELSILYLSKTSLLAGGGGGEERADAVTRRLAARGHDVTVLSGWTDPDLPVRTTDAGRTIRHVECVPEVCFRWSTAAFFATRYLFALVSLPVLVYLLATEEYDVLVENMTPYPTLAVVVAGALGVPVVAVQHEFFDRSAYDVYDPVTATIQLTLQRFHLLFPYAALVVPTTHVAEQFAEFGVPEERIEVIPNGVDIERFQRPDATTDPTRVLTLGRLTRRKGQALVIDALATLHERGHDVHLDVAGDGPARGSLERRVRKRGLGDVVTFHGFVDEDRKAELLNRAAVFCFASRQEGFGIVLLESMAAGTPVVASWTPVYGDFVTDGRHGLLVDRTPAALAASVGELLADPDTRERMGEHARHAAQSHSWETVVDRTESLLTTVADQRRPRAPEPA